MRPPAAWAVLWRLPRAVFARPRLAPRSRRRRLTIMLSRAASSTVRVRSSLKKRAKSPGYGTTIRDPGIGNERSLTQVQIRRVSRQTRQSRGNQRESKHHVPVTLMSEPSPFGCLSIIRFDQERSITCCWRTKRHACELIFEAKHLSRQRLDSRA